MTIEATLLPVKREGRDAQLATKIRRNSGDIISQGHQD